MTLLTHTTKTRRTIAFYHSLVAFVKQRTGFWQSLLETLTLGTIVGLLPYALIRIVGSPWTEIASLVAYPVIAYGAWRLASGGGRVWWRISRVLVWCAIYAVASGVISWAIIKAFPYHKPMYGMRTEALNYSASELILSMLLLTYTLVLPTRILMLLWAAAQQRIRWLLTFSYVLVGTITLVSIPAIFSLFIAVSSLSSAPLYAAPNDTAARLALALAPSVQAGVAAGELSPVLAGMLEGRAQLPSQPDQADAEVRDFNDLVGVRRLTLVGQDGVVLASAGEAAFADGQQLPREQQINWRLTLDQAAADCVIARPVDGPLPEAAVCPIVTSTGTPEALIIVENMSDPRTQWGASLGRIVAITMIGTSFTWFLALPLIIVILLIALGIGALIARQISRRLERLTLATSDVAAGNFARRIIVDREDELGRLSADFNAMAAQLQQREHALSAEAARAEAALQANKRLVANVSHELRTPLTTLRGYVEVLEQEYGDALPQRDLAVIHGEVDRLTGMIEDLFTLARAEAQQLPLTIETVDARALVTRLVETLAPLARRNRQIELICALPADLPLVQADRGRLEQVLLNLVQNALRHTPTGGIIAIEGTASVNNVALSVADTGEGIAPEELPLVFERFYRSDQSRARETGGAGLGLALARELAHAMGGEINATSDLGRGSRFTVMLSRA